MYKCPECGTEYTVVPDVCISCGHIPEEDAQLDLFAKARHQEQKTAEQQRELLQQFEARRAEKESAEQKRSAAIPEMPGSTEPPEAPETADIPVTSGSPEAAEKAFPPAEAKPVSPKALKAAAVCGAAAVALGGAAYFGPQIGKPAGFEKSSIGTFYMKENELWFQNGRTGKTLCLNPDLQITEMPTTRYEELLEQGEFLDPDFYRAFEAIPWVNRNLYVSPDGKEFYYPKQLSLENGTCTLMHCTADHPEEAEEITDIRFRETQYDSAFEERAFYANTYMQANPPKLNMNPSYLVYKGALYYRDLDGQFCCRRNGQTEVIAPVVERYWTMPEQEGVFYITITDYDAYKKEYGLSSGSMAAFVPDSGCMTQEIPVIMTEKGATLQMHSDLYSFYRTEPGEEPKRMVPEDFEDWKPFSTANPYYLYYTVTLPDEGKTELRRYNFRTEKATTVCSMEDEGRIMLIQDYPDGSCYYAYCRLTGEYEVSKAEIDDLKKMLQEIVDEYGADEVQSEMSLVLDDDGNVTQFTVRHSDLPDATDIYYQGKNSEPSLIMERKKGYFDATGGSIACAAQPYIWLENWGSSGEHIRKMFYRDQEVPVSIAADLSIYSPPESYVFSEDGTQLFAYITDYVYTNTQLYGTPRKTLVGELKEGEPIELMLAGETKDEASFVTLPLTDHPAEIVRVTPKGMFSGDQKIADNVYSGCFRYQPEYRQLCFIANEKNKAAVADNENVIPMNQSYCGTLMRRADRKTDVIAENVTGFIPADREHFAVICGEPDEAGVFNMCTPTGYYAADTGVTNLCGVREIPEATGLWEAFTESGSSESDSSE